MYHHDPVEQLALTMSFVMALVMFSVWVCMVVKYLLTGEMPLTLRVKTDADRRVSSGYRPRQHHAAARAAASSPHCAAGSSHPLNTITSLATEIRC